MALKMQAYWWDDAPRLHAEESTLPASVDAVVIGAGFSGLCTALSLARGGASVAIFESGELGCGASTLNGGMVGPSFHKLGLEGLKSKFGDERAKAILKESLNFIDFMENFLRDEAIDANFVRVGRFRGALKASHFDAMERELDILKASIDVQGDMVKPADQEAETSSKLFKGGVIYHQDAGLHPAKYHDGLVQRVTQAGGQIFTLCPVLDFQKMGDSFLVKTSKGDLKAKQIAVCTNGYTGKLTPALRRRVLPIRSAMIATEELPADLMASIMPKKRLYGDSRRLVAYYRPSPDGKRVLFGSRASGLKDRPILNSNQLKKSMVEIYPELKEVDITHVWSGLVAYTFDHVPHLGLFSPGVYYAMGYCGSGVARSSYFGLKLGSKMLGHSAGKTAFDDLAFDSFPLYTGNPWFMPYIMAWHRMADKLSL